MNVIDRKAGEAIRIGNLVLRVLSVEGDRVVLTLEGPGVVNAVPGEGDPRHRDRTTPAEEP